MKKYLFLLLVICVFLVSACSPAQGFAQKVVALPSPIQLAILSLATLVVSFVFTQIAKALPFLADFLGQYVDEVATALAGAVVMAIQSWLNAIPPEWEGVANAALALVVAILAAYGVIKGSKHIAYSVKVRRLMRAKQ